VRANSTQTQFDNFQVIRVATRPGRTGGPTQAEAASVERGAQGEGRASFSAAQEDKKQPAPRARASSVTTAGTMPRIQQQWRPSACALTRIPDAGEGASAAYRSHDQSTAGRVLRAQPMLP